jgi:Na+/H+-translocating membrane pyrophosphatase
MSHNVSQFLFFRDLPAVGLFVVVLPVVVFHPGIFFMALSPIALAAVFNLSFSLGNFIAITRSCGGMLWDPKQQSGVLPG